MLVTFAKYGDIEYFENTASENGFKFRIIDKRTSNDGKRVYRLYEFILG